MSAVEVRLLTGPHAGARGQLNPQQRSWSFGRASRCDIAVRDASIADLCCRLDLCDAVYKVAVLDGEIEILGVVVAAPGQAIIAPFIPFRLGETWIAIGDATNDARWADAVAIVNRVSNAQGGADPAIDATEDEPMVEPMPRRTMRWRATGLALTVMGIATALMAITQNDLADFSARANPQAAARGSIDRSQRIAPRGSDLLAPPDNPDPAEGLAPSVLPFGEDEKVVAIVTGKARFFVTSKGKRYDEGSDLPNGSRIISIKQNAITFEDNGLVRSITI